jgi:hypothetical protein
MIKQTPTVVVGTVFPAGKVVAIKSDHVLVETPEGVKRFSFQQIERFVSDQRSLSQA